LIVSSFWTWLNVIIWQKGKQSEEDSNETPCSYVDTAAFPKTQNKQTPWTKFI